MEMDKMTAAYVERRGWRVTPDGMIQLTKAQAAAEQYMGRSLRDPNKRTLMVASLYGTALLFEGRHFEII